MSLWCIKIRIEQVSSVHSREANRMSFIIARLPHVNAESFYVL